MAEQNPTQALIPSADVDPPQMVLARTLQEAPARSFLHVDRNGNVRSPTRYRVLQGASYAMLGGTLIAAMSLYGTILGAPGFAMGALLAAWAGFRVGQGRMVQHATQLMVHDHHAQAEVIFRRLLKGWATPAGVRALALQNLAALCNRQGRFEEALEHQRLAIKIYGRRSRQLFARTVGYAEVVTLVNLGRTDDARKSLAGLGPAPDGEYLRLLHWTAELYVCLAEGRHSWSEDQVHTAGRFALSITGASALLGLCAWAWWKLQDPDQAWLLLAESFERREGHHLPRAMPALYAWMKLHAAEAGVPAHALENEDT